MSARTKGILYGAGGVTLLFALLLGALFAFGFGAGPDEGSYTIEAGEKRLMLEAVTYDGTMYVPIDAVSFLQGREAVVDEESGRISFGAGKPDKGETCLPAQSALPVETVFPAQSALPQQEYSYPDEKTALENVRAFNEKEKGDILLESNSEIVYSTSLERWFWSISVSSASGKRIEIEKIEAYTHMVWQEIFFNDLQSYDKNKLAAAWEGSTSINAWEKKSLHALIGPVSDNHITYMDYYAYGRDEDGKEVRGALRIAFSKENMDAQANVPVEASVYDTATLRHNASFKVKVAEGVNWVPANTLGKSNMTADEIRALGNDPEALKAHIDTLYEVIQYLQVAGFKNAEDNIRIEEGGLSWEHHKPGELAITTNEGCCATDSNLLNYLLEGDYEEVGFAAYSQSDGSGHVFNYIKHNGLYYFIDLTHYRNDFMNTAIEDGTMGHYWKSDFIAGNIHEAARVEDYVKYCTNTAGNPPVLFSMYAAANVLPIGSRFTKDSVDIVYPESAEGIVKIILDHPGDSIRYTFEKSPSKYPPEWEPYNTRWD